MKQTIIISILVLLLLFGTAGAVIASDVSIKVDNASQLTYELDSVSVPELTPKTALEILAGDYHKPILLHVNERIINPTKSNFVIDEIDIQVLTPLTRSEVAKQVGKLSKPLTIKANNRDNFLTLGFDIIPANIALLVDENGGSDKIAKNRLWSPDYGLEFILTGTIKVFGIPIPIPLNERITI